MKWGPKDIIALVIVVLAGTLLIMGIDNIVGYSLLAVVCAYYGIELTPLFKIGRRKNNKGEDR